MLQYTAAGGGLRFVGIVHHTDADRKWAYDRPSHIGKLDEALAKGWTVVDMKTDWEHIYPFSNWGWRPAAPYRAPVSVCGSSGVR